MTGFIPANLKEKNSRVIYDLFADGNTYSKADISRLTGISAPTVIKIIDSLVQKQLLLSLGEGESAVGRKPNLLIRNARAYYAIGVDFQEGKVRVGLVDMDGVLIDNRARDLDLPLSKVLREDIPVMVRQLVEDNSIPFDKVLGVGLGLPGIVDIKRNTIEFAYNVGLNEKTDCTDMLRELENELTLPVYIENDINAAAIGEFKTRKLNSYHDLIYVSLGYGLGAGLVLRGKLRRGINNFAGEIAYTSFNEAYNTRKSPKGWIETEVCGDNKIDTALKNKEAAGEYIKFISKKIALMLANCAVFLDFDLIVIGGLLREHFGDAILQEVQKNFHYMSMFHVNCELAQSEFSELRGSAAIVCERRIKDIL